MERKELYIEKSLRLFLKYGIKSVTIGDIAQDLNISSKTIYKLFGDKTGLVKACLELDNQIIEDAYHQILNQDNILLALIEFYNALVKRISKVNPNYTNDIKAYFPQVWEKSASSNMQQIKLLLDRGIQQEYFSKQLNTQLAAETITLLIRSILDEESFRFEEYSRKDLSSTVIYPYLRGICTTKGRSEIRQYLSKGAMV